MGLVATLFAGFVFSKNKKIFFFLLIPAFLVAFQLQGGDFLKSRTETIIDYEGERSAETRLEAWGAAIDVPAKKAYVGTLVPLESLTQVLRTPSQYPSPSASTLLSPPGAATSMSGPKLEYQALFLLISTALTEITPA